jgi:glycosyltransferase involved in cell wall biosynthesis
MNRVDDQFSDPPRRVLYVSPGLDVRGGAERSLQGLIENLDRDEFAPELLVFGDGSLRQWAEGRSIPTHLLHVELPRGGKRRGPFGAISWGISALPSLLGRRRRLRRLLVERDIDLVHTNGLQASVVATQAITRFGVPVVMSVRDAPQRLFDKWVVRAITARSTVACNSSFVRDEYGFPAHHSHVVDNPIDRPSPHDRSEARQRLGLPADAFIIANASHYHPIKGHVHAIEAVAAVPGAHLAIAAAPLYGAASQTYMAQIDRAVAVAGNSVTLLGPLDDVSWLYAACDIVLHASVEAEGFGRTIAEGMMAERPVIASTCGAPGSMLENGETALLYPPGDRAALERCITRLRDDEALRDRLVAGGSRWVERFEPARHAAAMVEVYRQALGTGRPTAPRVLLLANGGETGAACERATRIGAVLSADGAQVTVVHQRSGRADLIRDGLRLARRADVVYAVDLSVATLLPAMITRARLIVDTGDAPSLFLRHVSAPLWKRVAARAMEGFAYRRASAFVVRGEGHLQHLPRPVLPRTSVIPDGVDLSMVREVDSTDLRHRLGLDDLIVVGMSAHYTNHHRIDTPLGRELVRAIDACRDLPVGGILIGDGAGLPELVAEIARLGLSDRIKTVGRVPYAELQQYLSVIDIAVLTQTDDPSSQVRTTGKLPVYLAMDRFVLASRVGTAGRILPEEMLIEYTGANDPAYPAKLAARIRRYVADGRKTPPGRLREMAERFDYDRIAHEAADVVIGVARRRRGRRR